MPSTSWYMTVLNWWKVRNNRLKEKNLCWKKILLKLPIMYLWAWVSIHKNQDSASKSQSYTTRWAKDCKAKVILRTISEFIVLTFRISQEYQHKHLFIAMLTDMLNSLRPWQVSNNFLKNGRKVILTYHSFMSREKPFKISSSSHLWKEVIMKPIAKICWPSINKLSIQQFQKIKPSNHTKEIYWLITKENFRHKE